MTPDEMTELKELISSALRMTSFTYGALAGSMILAFLPLRRDGRGLIFGAPFAVLAALGMSWHGDWTHWIIVGGVCVLLVGWFGILASEADALVDIQDRDQYERRAWYILLAEFPRSIWLLIASALVAPRIRRPTKVKRSAVERRIAGKKQIGARKKTRGPVRSED